MPNPVTNLHNNPASVLPAEVSAPSPHPVAYAVGTTIMFLLFSRASEFIDSTGRLHLVFALAILGFLALLVTGTLTLTLFSRPGVWLTLFTAWIVLGIPFSSWRGGSFHNFADIWVKCFMLFFLVGGLIFTLEQFRKSVFWLAAATVTLVYYAFRSGVNTSDDRLTGTIGTLGNSNDLAGALLMGVPFLLYVVIDSRRNPILRILAAAMTGVLMVVVLRTGSRGALLAIAALLLLAFFKATPLQKAGIFALCAIGAVAFPLVVSKGLIARYSTILTTNAATAGTAEVQSAILSTNARRTLMLQGMRITLKHPLFGVGLGNFSDASANMLIAKGEAPLWFTCHDIFLLVSSETGIPGLIFYCGTIVVCFRLLIRLQKDAWKVPALKQVGALAFCITVSLAAFVACGIFSTNAYTYQVPLLAALTTALERISRPLVERAKAERATPFLNAIPAFQRPLGIGPAPVVAAAGKIAALRV